MSAGPRTDGPPGAPTPLPPRKPRFRLPHRYGAGRRDRRFALIVAVSLHVALLAVLLVTDAVRLPDLGSLLTDAEDSRAGETVVYLPIEGLLGPRTSATPAPQGIAAPVPAPIVAPQGIPSGIASPPPAAATPPSAGGGVGAGAAGEGASADRAGEAFRRALEVLRPRPWDPRLRPGNASALRTDHERAALRAYARIRALNDSIMAEMAAGQRATDWTWTDDQGRRWGISPGKLHLGGIEIPLPTSTTGSREDRELLREWQEIQAQAEQGAIDETFDERVEAIRARRDAERAEE